MSQYPDLMSQPKTIMTASEKPKSIFEDINNTADNAFALMSRMEKLEDKLFGGDRAAQVESNAIPMPSGQQPRAFCQLDIIVRALGRTHDLISKLENL